MRVSRGGHTLKTGDIGRVNCLRQQIMMPGERMNMSLEGRIRLEALRERDSMRINAHLATFMTPLRWLVPEWPDYLKEGRQTDIVIPERVWYQYDKLGIGCTGLIGDDSQQMYSFWADAYYRIYNEWYKWPEAEDMQPNVQVPEGIATPLSKTWSRLRFKGGPDEDANYLLDSAENFDVRQLASKQAEFRGAMKRDVLSFNRWMELVKETWRGDGSREVDQVPIMLDQTEVGVNPREIPATDGASLGQWQSLFDFNVDHQIKGIVAPEHCIISTMLVIRFAATVEGTHPLRRNAQNWGFTVADPEFIAATQPQQVTANQLFPVDAGPSLGYAPAGWQWRSDHDVIGGAVDVRDSFPYSLRPNTQEECKDATRVKDAFRSQSLDDYLVDVFIKEDCNQPIGDSMDSYFSGMADDVVVNTGGQGQEFPKGGKNL